MIPRIATLFFTAVVCLIASMLLVAVRSGANPLDTSAHDTSAHDTSAHDHVESLAVSQPHSDAQVESVAAAPAAVSGTDAPRQLHPVTIRRPEGPPRIELAGVDPQGRTSSVACSTCHSVRAPNVENRTPETLDEFHQGMTFDHGKIACYACHNPSDADSLRLADGERVEYTDVMTLCSQCHGPQATAFAHGAHGGMNGFWDLSQGPQTKNNCIDCHDPHAPKYPKMIVSFKPKDRFNAPQPDSAHPSSAHATE